MSLIQVIRESKEAAIDAQEYERAALIRAVERDVLQAIRDWEHLVP